MTDTKATICLPVRGSPDQDGQEGGFTLIELLVVVVILGILIAIAIPLYLNYRKGANDSSAKADLKNAISVLEQCNTDLAVYPAGPLVATTVASVITSYAACAGQRINVSSGTTIAYFTGPAAALTGYIMTATNSNGGGKVYCYNSTVGGSVATGAMATVYRPAC